MPKRVRPHIPVLSIDGAPVELKLELWSMEQANEWRRDHLTNLSEIGGVYLRNGDPRAQEQWLTDYGRILHNPHYDAARKKRGDAAAMKLWKHLQSQPELRQSGVISTEADDFKITLPYDAQTDYLSNVSFAQSIIEQVKNAAQAFERQVQKERKPNDDLSPMEQARDAFEEKLLHAIAQHYCDTHEVVRRQGWGTVQGELCHELVVGYQYILDEFMNTAPSDMPGSRFDAVRKNLPQVIVEGMGWLNDKRNYYVKVEKYEQAAALDRLTYGFADTVRDLMDADKNRGGPAR